jgi:hypothetical protein
MRNLVINEIIELIQLLPVPYAIKPWDLYSNRDLLELYGKLRIDIETEEYDEN